MSDASGFNRWFIIAVALVAGFLMGLAFAVYLFLAWVPAEFILRDAPPRYLRYDPSGQVAQYRDVYVARVADRYAKVVQAGQPDVALTQAQQALGVATGDATPLEALAMVRAAEQAARIENSRPEDQAAPDSGWFTLADQDNLSALAQRLDQVKDQPVVIPQSVLDARRNVAIFGAILLLLWIGLLAATLALIANALKPPSVPAAAVVHSTPTIAPQPADMAVSAQPAAVPTQPAYAPLPQSPAVRAVSPVPGETLIHTFPTVYEHGDERYDEGFQIASSSGELIGECGASIADRVSLASPSRVTALAIWVFDKSDFHSKNKILLTPYAFEDEVMRNKLATRGDLVRAEPGTIEIATSMLRVEVEITDLQLGPIDHHPDGYYQRVALQFRVYKRP